MQLNDVKQRKLTFYLKIFMKEGLKGFHTDFWKPDIAETKVCWFK